MRPEPSARKRAAGGESQGLLASSGASGTGAGGRWSKPLRFSFHFTGSSRERRSGTSHGAMSRKGLITDSFQVVKKKEGRKERKEAQSPPQDLPVVQAESHLQDPAQPDQLEILKQFDLSWQYGPCTGITRMQRWERAKFLGLNPPTTVQDLLLKYNEDPFVIYSLWHEYTL